MVKSDTSDDIAHNPFRNLFESITDLPKLPNIQDDQLKRAATTHPSVPLVGVSAEKRYERLAFVGEGILFTFITSLIQDLFPDIDKDSASILRAKLTSSPVLSAISIHYNLPSQITISRHLIDITSKSIKGTSEMFQAYLGGLSYSYEKEYLSRGEDDKFDPALRELKDDNGINTSRAYQAVQDENKDTQDGGKKNKKRKLNPASKETNHPNKVILHDISNPPASDQAERQSLKYRAESYSYIQIISTFLLPLFSPIAMKLFDKDESENRKLLKLSENSKAELHLLLGRDKLPMPIYTSDKVLPDHLAAAKGAGKGEYGLMWKVRCTVVFPIEQIIIREEGIASNSKDAGNIAAYLALQKVREIRLEEKRRKREEIGNQLSEKV